MNQWWHSHRRMSTVWNASAHMDLRGLIKEFQSAQKLSFIHNDTTDQLQWPLMQYLNQCSYEITHQTGLNRMGTLGPNHKERSSRPDHTQGSSLTHIHALCSRIAPRWTNHVDSHFANDYFSILLTKLLHFLQLLWDQLFQPLLQTTLHTHTERERERERYHKTEK